MATQVFKSMDKDGSGTITKEEFLKICKNLSKEQVGLDLTQYLRIKQSLTHSSFNWKTNVYCNFSLWVAYEV